MTARPTPPSADARAPGGESAPGLLIHGESGYDRVTSMLMAVIIGAVIIVGWLGLVYLTNRSYARSVPAPIEIIEVYGGGGGTPEGEEGSTERIDVPDAAAAAFASNNELSPAAFEEPAVQQTPSGMVEALSTELFADLAEEMPQGGPVATGVRASKLGSGRRMPRTFGISGAIRRQATMSLKFA